MSACDAQYGRNPDLCYREAGHAGVHSNRYGTTWAQPGQWTGWGNERDHDGPGESTTGGSK